MKRSLAVCLATIAGGSLALTGCAGITVGAPTQAGLASELPPIEETSAPVEPGFAAGTVSVVLPDATQGSCWDEQRQEFIENAFAASNIPVTIQNASGDPATFVSLATDSVMKGAGVLVIVNLDAASGAEAIAAANSNGIPAVDYDKLTINGGAQYFVGVKGAPDCSTLSPRTVQAEAEALASLAQALTSSDPTSADGLAVDVTPDPEAGYDVPSILVAP